VLQVLTLVGAGLVAAAEPAVAEPLPAALAPGDDLFTTGMATSHDKDPGLWLSWSLVDLSRGRRVGSANSGTDRTNAESSIKAWIAADYLRVARDQGRAVTAAEQADITAAVRRSDNGAAERLYRALGRDAVLRHLGPVCGVSVSTTHPAYWSLTQITAVDATRIFACVLRTAPGHPGGDGLLADLRSVDAAGSFGIKSALPATTRVALKNGWMPHAGSGKWNVNCVASWDGYVLAVLTRYPVSRPLAYGAGVCLDLAAELVGRLGGTGPN
jgi:hypothetical protein